MAKIWYGHFDSTPEILRPMLAADWAAYIRSFITSGVRNLGTNLLVQADTGLAVKVSGGIANNDGYIYRLEPDINGDTLPVQLEPAHPSYPRIDRVVLRLDLRPNQTPMGIYPLTGVASANPVPPELTRNAEVREMSLSRWKVAKGAVSLQPADGTDERTDTELCGVINSVLGLDPSVWQAQFDAFLARMEQQEREFLAQHGEQFNTQLTQQSDDWQEQTDQQAADQQAAMTSFAEWLDGAKVDIATLQSFDFDNLAVLPGVTFKTVFANGGVMSTIKRPGGGLLATRETTFPGGAVVTVVTRYEEDGVTVKNKTQVRTEFRSGEIAGGVTSL